MNTEAQEIPLLHVISPRGHTPQPHDVSYSFHLATVLSALQVRCKPLKESDECRLLESYAFNLVNDGCWEWAIYVLLCSFSEDSITKRKMSWKKKMSMDIICTNYSDDLESKKRRDFLETKLGIPSHWFDIALSYRSIDSLHQQALTHAVTDSSLSKALATFEETTLPSIIFDGDQDRHNELISYLEQIYNKLGESSIMSFGGLVLEYLRLSRDVLQFSLNDDMEINFDDMFLKAEQIQGAICKLQTSGKCWGTAKVPRRIAIAEFESAVRLLMVQLRVIKGGGSILETNRVYEKTELKALKIISKLGYTLSNKNDEVTLPFDHVGGLAMLRGKCGMEIEI